MTLAEIIERLEKATGPDRELDKALYYRVAKHLHRRGAYLNGRVPMVAITYDGRMWAALPAKERRGGPQMWHGAGFAPVVTGSVDDALEFAERVLPGASRNILLAAIYSDNVKADDRFLRTLPIGVCLALCRALQAQETPHDE